jgi:hypothetical protein
MTESSSAAPIPLGDPTQPVEIEHLQHKNIPGQDLYLTELAGYPRDSLAAET